jgi:hypothetical protein
MSLPAARYVWALLLARIDEGSPLRGTLYGVHMRIIAFVMEAPALETLLEHLSEPTAAPETVQIPIRFSQTFGVELPPSMWIPDS